MIISLETITTVGYSVSDINFGLFFSLASLSGDHTLAFFLLYGEMMQAILMNSFCIGIVYTRLSRAIVLLSPFSLSPSDSLSFPHLLQPSHHQANPRPMVPHLPGLRAPQAPARREPHFLLLRAENHQRRQRRALPNDSHAAHRSLFPLFFTHSTLLRRTTDLSSSCSPRSWYSPRGSLT